LSENVPFASSCALCPRAIGAVGDVTLRAFKVAFETTNDAEPLLPYAFATIVAVPTATGETTPPTVTVAMLEFIVLHVAAAVTSSVLPSLYVATTPNFTVLPNAMEVWPGETARDTRCGAPHPVESNTVTTPIAPTIERGTERRELIRIRIAEELLTGQLARFSGYKLFL
jgi:hypothetical protein